MSGYPLLLEGSRIGALVVGGGRVAHRKAMALLESGAAVRVIAPEITSPLCEAAVHWPRLLLVERAYASSDIGDAVLVIAATNVREVNAAVTADAIASGRLVNVADFPEDGTCVTVASHSSGSLVVGVSAGGVPDAATLVHPRLPGTTYPFGQLSGAAVAFKLAWALAQRACACDNAPASEWSR